MNRLETRLTKLEGISDKIPERGMSDLELANRVLFMLNNPRLHESKVVARVTELINAAKEKMEAE